jgi:DNA-binding NarL/FixJ family response regulator
MINEPLAEARALVVEDDRSWQQILEEILTDAGLEVDIADSLKAAIARLQAVPHRLAVVDLSLGRHDHANEDGLRVLDAVRLHDPNCVTLLLTGYATVEIAVSSLAEHGAFTCLRKSAFSRSEFRKLVHQALAHAPALETIRPKSPRTVLLQDQGEERSGPDEETGLALVIEDDASWRNIFSELLTETGYRVRMCGSFGEALGYLRHEEFDLAVLDLSLSHLDDVTLEQEGYRLLDRTRQAGIPTLVVSGTAGPEDIERAYGEHGAFACLEKQSFDRRAFLQRVEEARNSGRQCDEIACLTAREREVLALLARGVTNKDIAEALFITNNTVKRHLKAIFEKLDVHTRSAAVAKAIKAGFLATPRT